MTTEAGIGRREASTPSPAAGSSCGRITPGCGSKLLWAALAGVALSLSAATVLNAAEPDPQLWRRCSLHTHTDDKLGTGVDGRIDYIADWYKRHGYQCVVMTEHERVIDVTQANARFGEPDRFLVIPGQEITQAARPPDRAGRTVHSHMNAINIARRILPVGHPDEKSPGRPIVPVLPLRELYARNLAEIEAQGGLAQVNHPNIFFSVKAADLECLKEPFLMEIWNAGPETNNLGGQTDDGQSSPSTESLWDTLLSLGKVAWGTATDDAHEYANFDDPNRLHPGKAWVMVDAPTLTPAAVVEALRRGAFYASNGVELDRIETTSDAITLTVKTGVWRNYEHTYPRHSSFATRFVGRNGRLLAEVAGQSPSYRFRGDEGYVRAVITDSDGRKAWTQPIFLDDRAK